MAKKFKYNGIEFEEALGMNLYEMDLRQYDPAIARWTSIDPVTHHSMSPYTAFDNNPVFWADPSGADSEFTGMDSRLSSSNLLGDEEQEEENSDSEGDCPKCETFEDYYNYYSALLKSPVVQEKAKQGLKDTGTGALKGTLQSFSDMQESVGLHRTFDITKVKESEKLGFGLGIILFALLEPGPGGEAKLLQKLPKITKKYGLFKCVQCADEMVNLLKSEGVKGTLLEIRTIGSKGMAGNIWSDVMQTNISTNGRHQAVQVGNMVFDNVHKKGIEYNKWIKDFFSPTGYNIKKTKF